MSGPSDFSWIWPSSGGPDPADRGLAYADGLFETILMGPRGPVLLDTHLARLRRGADSLGIPCADSVLSFWWSEARRRWLAGGRGEGIIKLILTRGTGGRGYRPPATARPTMLTSFHERPPATPSTGVKTALCPVAVTCLGPGGAKGLARGEQVAAAARTPVDCFEGIMTDVRGRPLEGTRSNLFAFEKDGMVTPPANQLAVVGVMRDFLLRRLPSLGIPVREAPLSWQSLRRGNGLLLCNSVFGMASVSRVGCLQLPLDDRIARIRRLLEREFGFHFID